MGRKHSVDEMLDNRSVSAIKKLTQQVEALQRIVQQNACNHALTESRETATGTLYSCRCGEKTRYRPDPMM